MYRIVIGIPTYKRPNMLKKLILCIKDCIVDKSLISDIIIIVIDNDIDRTAEIIVKKLTDNLHYFSKLVYNSYPVKGLSNVRNELFRKALDHSPDFIICIDDDEYPSANWLNQLLLTITATKSDIVMGPVLPVFDTKVSPCISCWFKYEKLINYKKVDFFYTGNFIIDTKFLLKHKLKFDNRFNFTGSEDSYFGVKALEAGANICWAENAVVYESIPLNRARLIWLMKRRYNGGVSFTYILKTEKNYSGILKKILVSIAYFISGFLFLVLVLFPIKWRYWGILKISEGLGGFAGLFGIRFNEYAKDR